MTVQRSSIRARTALLVLVAPLVIAACVTQGVRSSGLHRWWAGLGPVLPHEKFPADCSLCHVGDDWQTLVADFSFDHEKETGVALNGAHAAARCIRCHNDRGPVQVFAAKGCMGCHEDVHQGALGSHCTQCHTESTWNPVGQIEMHSKTRFPLTGAHAHTACHRCHPGSFVGTIQPVDTECVTCHRDDLARAVNPPHINLGLVNRCHRCHLPTRWNQVSTR